jgi:uncharacterized membrane protein
VDVVQVAAVWLHSLATVVLLGYCTVLALVVVPVLRSVVNGPALGRILPDIERRALPLIAAAIGIFLVTGLYLMLSDARFPGFGHFFGSTWSTLIVFKHVVVVALVGVGVYLDLLVMPAIAGPVDEAARTSAVTRLARGATVMVVLGAIVLLLTAAAQGLDRAAP